MIEFKRWLPHYNLKCRAALYSAGYSMPGVSQCLVTGYEVLGRKQKSSMLGQVPRVVVATKYRLIYA